MHTIISRMPKQKIDNRTTAAKQAAKALGVTLKNEASEVRTTYGAAQAFTQVWWTKCGNNLVVDADNNNVEAALCTGDFDWDADVYSDDRNYQAMAEAAGIRGADA